MKKAIGSLFLFLSCSAVLAQQINIAGSNTLILLGQRLSQQYKYHAPDAKFSIHVGRIGIGIFQSRIGHRCCARRRSFCQSPYPQEAVLRGEEPYPFVGKNNPKELADVIAATPNGIGYSSLRYAPEVKTVGIKLGQASVPVLPTSQTIRSREYPISRYIYWHFARKPTGELRAFTEWAMSQEGQTVVESIGFEPLLPSDRKLSLVALGLGGTELGQRR